LAKKKAPVKKKKKATRGDRKKKKYTFIILNHNTNKFEQADTPVEAGVHVERMASSQSDEQKELEGYLDRIKVFQVSDNNEIDFETDFTVAADVTVEEKEDL
jgi:hypothetical protein